MIAKETRISSGSVSRGECLAGLDRKADHELCLLWASRTLSACAAGRPCDAGDILDGERRWLERPDGALFSTLVVFCAH